MKKLNIIFQLTGSIACFKACAVISKLHQEGHSIQTVCSDSALQFIGEATLEGLTGKPVHTSVFQKGQMMDHIYLAKWAQLAILCPATANSINKLSAGIGDDIIGSLFLGWNLKAKPYLIFPAMNMNMYDNPITQKSLGTLKELGAVVAPTDSGHQACGDEGFGRMLETESILSFISQESLKWGLQ